MATTRRDKEKQNARRTSAKEWADKQSQGFEATAVKLPEGVEFYKLEIGRHLIDFMPFKAGKGNKRADEGFEHFEREYATHRIQGPDGRGRLYCCRYETFGKKCPVCEYLNGAGVEEQLRKDLRPRTRNLWLVNDKPGNSKPKWKVFDVSHYNRGNGFGEQITEVIKTDEHGDTFANLEGGASLQLLVKEQTMPGNKFNAVTRVDLKPRDYNYPDALLDKAPCLDDMLIDLGYEGLKKVLNQDESTDDDDDRKSPSRNGTPKGTGDDSDVEDDEDQDDEPKAKKKADPDSSDLEDDDEDDDYAPKTAKKKAAAKDDDSDPEDDEDGEDDDEPKSAKKKGKEPVASDFDIEVGSWVMHDDHGKCEVVKVSPDGTSLTLEDSEDELHRAISPEDVELLKSTKKLSRKEADDDDDEDDKPAKGKKKPADDDSDVEDDEDEGDDDDSPLEDEDDKPAKKKTKK